MEEGKNAVEPLPGEAPQAKPGVVIDIQYAELQAIVTKAYDKYHWDRSGLCIDEYIAREIWTAGYRKA